MQTITKTRGVKGAASVCALTAMLYLLCKWLFELLASVLMGLKIKGATLADPVGFSRAATLLIMLAMGVLSILVPVVWLLRCTRLTVQDLRITRPAPWSPAFSILLFLGLANVGNLLGGLLGRLLGTSGNLQVLPAGGAELFLSYLALCVLPAIAEEVLFRGALQGLMRPCGSVAAIVAPALLFALLHLDLIQCITALLCGLFLGWMAERTGSILPGMLLHLINNSLAFLDIYLLLYAPSALALGVEMLILVGLPILAGWLVWQAIHKQGFSVTAGLRPGVAAASVFTSPAYTVAVAFLLVYTVWLCFAT